MHDSFLTAAEQIKLLEGARSLSYQAYLKAVRAIPGISVAVHGLELTSGLEPPEGGSAAPDFSLLIEAYPVQPLHSSHPLASLIDLLSGILGCSALWVEFDAEQWDPPNPHPRGLPLIYVSPEARLTPVTFTDQCLPELLKTLRQWLVDQRWEGHAMPEDESVAEWLAQLPGNSRIQQFGLAFRGGKVQPRVLLDLPKSGAVLQLLKEIGAPECLQDPSLEAQMLVAMAYPYRPQQMMGLEILADRCGLSNLRSLRHPPRMRGSRLERVLRSLSRLDPIKANLDYFAQLSSLEGRFSSQLQSDTLVIRLRGVNHLKLILQQGQWMQLKAYAGEVENRFGINGQDGSTG
jgi:hypothetical protein